MHGSSYAEKISGVNWISWEFLHSVFCWAEHFGYTGLQWWELIPVVLNPCDEPCYDRILVILLFPLELENIPLVTVELLYFGVSWGRGFTLNPHLRCLSLSYLWVCACAQSVHGVWLFVTPWTVAHQAPWSMGISQVRKLEWVASPSSRGSFQPRDGTCVFCLGQWILYHQAT